MSFRTGISYVQDLVKSARKYYKKNEEDLREQTFLYFTNKLKGADDE